MTGPTAVRPTAAALLATRAPTCGSRPSLRPLQPASSAPPTPSPLYPTTVVGCDSTAAQQSHRYNVRSSWARVWPIMSKLRVLRVLRVLRAGLGRVRTTGHCVLCAVWTPHPAAAQESNLTPQPNVYAAETVFFAAWSGANRGEIGGNLGAACKSIVRYVLESRVSTQN